MCAKKPHLRMKEGGRGGDSFQNPGAHKRGRIYAEWTTCLVSYVSDGDSSSDTEKRGTPARLPPKTPAIIIQVLLLVFIVIVENVSVVLHCSCAQAEAWPQRTPPMFGKQAPARA